MFTGIVEAQHKIIKITKEGSNTNFCFSGDMIPELKIDQSVSHNGICLTVTSIDLGSSSYEVTAIKETLDKTNAGAWQINDEINIERCLPATGRFDGHMVQGHVDGVGLIDEIHDYNGSRMVFISHPALSKILAGTSKFSFNRIFHDSKAFVFGASYTAINQMDLGDPPSVAC